MIETLASPDDVVAVKISGDVDKEQWTQIITFVKEKLERHEKVSIYADLTTLESMSAGAVLEDMKFALTNFGDLSRIPRTALVTDKDWIETAGDLGAKLIPALEFRAFDSGEQADALRWVSS